MSDVQGIVCFWKFVPAKESDPKRWIKWELVESYAVDHDNYPMTKPSTGGGSQDEHLKWMHTYDEDGSIDDYIMGRAVTFWHPEDGVKLMDLHPPEWSVWLSTAFIEKIRKLADWASYFEKGHDFHFGTVAEVEKYLTLKGDKSA